MRSTEWKNAFFLLGTDLIRKLLFRTRRKPVLGVSPKRSLFLTVLKSNLRTKSSMPAPKPICTPAILVLTATLLVSSCGFHLRGAYQVPEALRSVHLSSEIPSSPIMNNLRRNMLSSGVEIAATDTDAPYTLHLSNERSEKRSISVDSLAAAAEFQLRQFISYELRDANDRLILGPYELITERNFQNDINNVVGKRDEERLIREEMQVQLALQIMRRYQAIDANQLYSEAGAASN